MKIEIWSDVICPWCYIGKRRFEKAVAQTGLPPGTEIIWRSFELDATAPAQDSTPLVERLAKKYHVSRDEAEAMNARVASVATEEGLHYRLDIAKPGNTFNAHRLAHFAASRGLGEKLMERLMQGYFCEGLAVGDTETLVSVGTDAGLDGVEVRAMLSGNDFADMVRADERRAAMFNIRGVPYFVFDERFAISGAQPMRIFLAGLQEFSRAVT